MIPGMALLLSGRAGANQHLFQAAAMVINIAVAFPAWRRHRRAGGVPGDLVRWLLPTMVVFMVVGVALSNTLDSTVLRKAFAGFLLLVAASTFWKLARRTPDHHAEATRVTPGRGLAIGAITGTVGGLLGLGGGVLAVPLIQAWCKLPLRRAIAASSSVMVFSSMVGATFKVATLGGHGARWTDAVTVAAALAPTALVGGHFGAVLTHQVPINAVRIVFGLTVLAMSLRMWGVF